MRLPGQKPVGPEVRRGREASARKAWADAYDALIRADAAEALGGEDLERLAWAAAMLGRAEEMLAAFERLHAVRLAAGELHGAAQAAFWIGFRLLSLGEVGRASGWFGRAEHLRDPGDEVLRGWLLTPRIYGHQRGGDLDRAFELAAEAASAGERRRDADLTAFARTQQGSSRLRQGRVREGLALLDEAMLLATTTELNPVVTGLIYCTMIGGCARVYALDRAREWTGVLSRWCESQPQLVAFTSTCLVHRAEILELDGSWRESIAEAQRVPPRDVAAAGAGFYQQGEIHRLLGEHDKAEAAYQEARRNGRDPQPGLALLRLAQGRTDAASKAIHRALESTADRMLRPRLLRAQVEIALSAGDLDRARRAAVELEALAQGAESVALSAFADQAQGSVLLAGDRAAEALPSLRRALEAWHELSAPYLAARARVLVGRACRALGDSDGARLELEAARAVFQKLGAAADLARLDGSVRGKAPLTPRELQVLRLVAAGETNGAVARVLRLSEKTVDRHLSNIFAKLGVPSRAAATAQAIRLELL